MNFIRKEFYFILFYDYTNLSNSVLVINIRAHTNLMPVYMVNFIVPQENRRVIYRSSVGGHTGHGGVAKVPFNTTCRFLPKMAFVSFPV